ncbi:MAG: hypothetical protein M3Q52_04155, partial [Pseudomonadota bacterium]|nr:hypothetical protein [Pseudomonadota bacterium]
MTGQIARGAPSALFHDYRKFAGWRLPFGLLLMVGSAVAEGVGILMIVPLVAVALGGAQLPEELNALG